MQKVFLAYANSRDQPLPTLQEEEEQVYRMLARREAERHFSLHRDAYTSIPKIAEYLALYQEDILVFHYSGHAEPGMLLLDDEAANAAGIAALLSRCPRLQLVVLNGCSTRSQVDRLLEAGLPAVIATSAPIGDRTATQFAVSFYQSLAEQHASLGEAFEAAIAAAQTQSEVQLMVEKRAGRPAAESVGESGRWGLYYRDDSVLTWKLPLAAQAPDTAYTPNQQLIERLMEALAPYDAEINKINSQEALGIERSLGEKKKTILRCLPHPISQQLRKLMSREKGMEEHVFYDKPGSERLWQIGNTYATMIELLAFILLADLWRGVESNQRLPPGAALSKLQAFVARPVGQENPYDFISLIRSLRELMEANELPFFMEEFLRISRIFNEETPFAAACRFLEVLRRRARGSYTQEEAAQLCATAEDKLATVFGELGFLAAYSLVSVRNIDVLKYRYPADPLFNHRVIRLEQEFLELEEVPEVLDAFMDSSSVLLQRKQGEKYSYLNLSPFVIDESAFDKKAELAKLLFFERYAKGTDTHRYRHVYKPDDAPVLVSSEHKHFKPLRVQFDAFSRSLFNQNLKDL